MPIIRGHVKDKKTGKSIKGAKIVGMNFGEEPTVVIQMVPSKKAEEKTVDTFETITDENGGFEKKITKGYYSFSVTANGYKTDNWKQNIVKDVIIHFDRPIDPLRMGKLEGKVVVTNLNGIPVTGIRIKIEGEKNEEVVAGNDGKFLTQLLPEGEYTLKILEPEKHFLHPSSIKATVIGDDNGSTTNTKDIPVEMMSIPKAILGLKRKKTWYGKGGEKVDQGYCKLVRLNPSKPDELETKASVTVDAEKDAEYGWFEFNDLTPGIYAVTFFKPANPNDIRKYSTYFTIDKEKLEKYKDLPFPIGGKNGKDQLQEDWNSFKEVTDKINTILGMAEKVKDILVPFGLKIGEGDDGSDEQSNDSNKD